MNTDNARHAPTPDALILGGLGLQLVGVTVQLVWHVVPVPAPASNLPNPAFLIDHTVSNLGVACLVGGTYRLWSRERHPHSWTGRLIYLGTALEVLGAVGDLIAHIGGTENRTAYGAIGLGFLLAAAGSLTRITRRHRRPRNR